MVKQHNCEGYKKLVDWVISRQVPKRKSFNDYFPQRESRFQVKSKWVTSLIKDEDIVCTHMKVCAYLNDMV